MVFPILLYGLPALRNKGSSGAYLLVTCKQLRISLKSATGFAASWPRSRWNWPGYRSAATLGL